MHRDINVISSGGIELRGLKANLAPRKQMSQAPPKLEKYLFVPYINTKAMSKNNALTVCLQTALENCGEILKMKVAELAYKKSGPEDYLAPNVIDILESEPKVTVSIRFSLLIPNALPGPF